jgi:hypothetical protein
MSLGCALAEMAKDYSAMKKFAAQESLYCARPETLTSFWPSQALLTSPGHPTLLLHLSIALLHLKEFAMARTHMEYMLGMGNHPLYKTEFKEAHSPPWHFAFV